MARWLVMTFMHNISPGLGALSALPSGKGVPLDLSHECITGHDRSLPSGQRLTRGK